MDKLRYLNIITSGNASGGASARLQLVREMPVRGCTEVQFAEGGHYFAAAQGFQVFVVDAYTFKLKGQALRGHQQDVLSIAWGPR